MAIERQIDDLASRITGKNRYLLTAGNAFTLPDNGPFFIEVVAAGNVVYTTEGGQGAFTGQTEAMSVGYHPTSFVKIFAGTAVNLVIIW